MTPEELLGHVKLCLRPAIELNDDGGPWVGDSYLEDGALVVLVDDGGEKFRKFRLTVSEESP